MGSRIANRPLAVGLVLCITLNGFEALAVVATMPTVSKELNGDALYGAAFSVYMLANIVSIVVSGNLADRHGPARSCVMGLITFTTGLVLAGVAPSMWILVTGRALQGFGGGALAATAYVGVARGFPAEQHPRLFSLLSSAWVIPGLVAPPLAGWISEVLSWRWVFFGLLPLIPVLFVLTVPALRKMPLPVDVEEESGRLRQALLVAAGAGLVVAGLSSSRWWLLVAGAVGGVLVGSGALRSLMPTGFLTASPGLPAAIAARSLLSLAFFGVDTFIPFTVERIHDAGTTMAGLSITTASLTWTAGSFTQARYADRWRPGPTMTAGMGFLIAGIGLTIPVAWPSVPYQLAFLSWAIAGFGMGLSFNASNVAAFAVAPEGREGSVSAQLQIGDALGFAIAGGIGGAIINAADRGGYSETAAVATQWALMLVLAFVGLWAARRVSAAVRSEPATAS